VTRTAHVADGLAHAVLDHLQGPTGSPVGSAFASASIARRVHGLTIPTAASTSARNVVASRGWTDAAGTCDRLLWSAALWSVSRTTPCKRANSPAQHSRLLLLFFSPNIDPEKGEFARGDGV